MNCLSFISPSWPASDSHDIGFEGSRKAAGGSAPAAPSPSLPVDSLEDKKRGNFNTGQGGQPDRKVAPRGGNRAITLTVALYI
jgi:hypothetical protein